MKRIIFLLSLSLLSISPAWAGKISLETHIKASVQGNTLNAAITTTNRGDESAFNVQVKTDASMSPSESKLEPVLPVGKTYTATLLQPNTRLLPGRYPFVARILYADANLYPFSALAISYFVHQKDAASRVLGVLEKAEIRREGRLTLKLRNLEEQALELHVRLLLPQELSSDSSSRQVRLLPQQETVIQFSIRNFSALDGSVYAVYALVEYENAGLHYTTLAPGAITIRAEKPSGSYWMSGAIVLVIIFILVNVLPSRKRKVTSAVKK